MADRVGVRVLVSAWAHLPRDVIDAEDEADAITLAGKLRRSGVIRTQTRHYFPSSFFFLLLFLLLDAFLFVKKKGVGLGAEGW